MAAEPPSCDAAASPSPLHLPCRIPSETKQSLPHMKSVKPLCAASLLTLLVAGRLPAAVP